MICSRITSFQVFVGLIAITLALPIQDSPQTNDRQVRDTTCNDELVYQALPYAKSAIDKADYITNTLKLMFEEHLSSCSPTFINNEAAYQVVLKAFLTTQFDATKLIPDHEPDHSCSHLQNEINSTISYMECATNYMGLILQNLTIDALQLNRSDSISLKRNVVYDAYKNVSWITDIKNLTKVFACAPKDDDSTATPECVISYDSINIVELTHPYNECVIDILSRNGAVSQKQTIVLAHINEIISRMRNNINYYSSKCLQLPAY